MKWLLFPLSLLLAMAPLGVVHPLKVEGQSMFPLLRNGQVVWILRTPFAGTPERGQIWLVKTPEGSAVKRLVGLPGERIEMKEGWVYLDHLRMEEASSVRLDQSQMGPLEGEGYLFLGDNRSHSRDGRNWGLLPESALEGRVLGLDSTRSS